MEFSTIEPSPGGGFRIPNQASGEGVGGQMAHRRKSTIWPIFLHSKQQKTCQGILRTQEPTPIRSQTSHGPSMDPTGPLK